MEEPKIAIVGGGPAGLQAAITVAKQGFQPVVFEEHQRIGSPIQCGEGMSLKAFHDFSIPTTNNEFCVREHKQCQLVFPSNKILYGDIHAFMIKRDSFDQYLANKAIEAGAEIKTNTKILEIRRKPEGSIIKLKGQDKTTYFSHFLILAEGARAKLAQNLSFSSPQLIKAFEYRIEGEWGEDLEFHFDAQDYPSGYCWIFPRDNETNVGIVTTAKQMKTRLDSFLKKKKIKGKIVKKIGGAIPMKGPVSKLASNNIVLAGDTAGMVNPIFYGGIRIGMTSGKFAGKVGVEYLTSLEEGTEYSTQQYSQYLSQLQFMQDVNLKCHNFFYSRSNSFLTKLGKTFDKKSINQITGWEKAKIFGNLLKNPSLLKYPRGLLRIYLGFKIARDWGF
ncbi:MAG: NAD(P)/FAD-dependent oxidoreductase [Candidatus Heimdallarchaeota archaeon]|nr:NAD(P)/FAD-dependent oxidoreductase [Candidatus Heimdallarchaeota archaeon]